MNTTEYRIDKTAMMNGKLMNGYFIKVKDEKLKWRTLFIEFNSLDKAKEYIRFISVCNGQNHEPNYPVVYGPDGDEIQL